MERAPKSRMSKRLLRQYVEVLEGDSIDQYWTYGWLKRAPKEHLHAWAAYIFAKQWRGRRGVNVARLQNIVARSENAEAAYEWARNIRGANVRKMQRVVTRFGSLNLIRAFAQNVPGADREYLNRLCVVKEVLAP